MTAAKTRSYIARPDSLAHHVMSFLVANPDEELRADDICVKFGGSTSNLSANLQRALACGAIERKHGVYRLGNLALAKDAIGEAGQAVRDQAGTQAQQVVALMTAAARRQPPASIDAASGEAWNAAAAAARPAPMSVTLPTGAVVQLEEAPYISRRRLTSVSPLDLVIDAIAATRPAPGRTVRCALPEGITDRFAVGALRRWHIRHGHRSTRLVEIVRIQTGQTVTAMLQRTPVTA